MNNQEYQMLAKRTAKDMGTKELQLVHSALGLAGEAGEFTDAVKKNFIYGKPTDVANLVEEMGDALWYIALACNTLGITIGEVMQQNINKLQLRYPEKYSDQHAVARLDKVAVDPNPAEAFLGITAINASLAAEFRTGEK